MTSDSCPAAYQPSPQVTPQLIATATLRLDTPGAGFTDITGHAASFLAQIGAGEGTLLIFLRHTSASLTIQENADPDVQTRPHLRARSSRAGRRALDSRRGGARRHAGACEGDAHRRVAARAGDRRPSSRSAPGRASIWSSTGGRRTAARSCCNSSAAAQNKCGAQRAPHIAWILSLDSKLFDHAGSHLRPRRSFGAFRASGTARVSSTPQERRSDRSARRRRCRSPGRPRR